jgi:nicotinamide mononucleotide transporter
MLHIDNIVFECLGYKMSWVELLGMLFNLAAVWLSAKERISSWYIGLVGVVLYFILFYQIHLYADMTLQVFFFVTNCIGWYQWANPKVGLENQSQQLRITTLSPFAHFVVLCSTLFLALFLGRFFLHIHEYFPTYFSGPADFPYADSFVMAGSIVAQVLLMRKKIESWLFWIGVNLLAIFIYTMKGIYLTSVLYLLFLVIALQGFVSWRKSLKQATVN